MFHLINKNNTFKFSYTILFGTLPNCLHCHQPWDRDRIKQRYYNMFSLGVSIFSFISRYGRHALFALFISLLNPLFTYLFSPFNIRINIHSFINFSSCHSWTVGKDCFADETLSLWFECLHPFAVVPPPRYQLTKITEFYYLFNYLATHHYCNVSCNCYRFIFVVTNMVTITLLLHNLHTR